MRRTVVAVTLALAWSASVMAQEAGSKVAFVDVQKALLAVDEGKAKRQELLDWAAPRQKELQQLEQEIQNLQQELLSKQASAAPEQLSELNRQLTAKKRQFEDKQRQYTRELEEKQNQVLKSLGEKMEKLLAEYAESQKLSAVFILQQQLVAYVANSADITDTLVQLYNQRYPYPPQGGK